MMWEQEHFLWNRKWLWILMILGMGLLLSYLQPLQLSEGGEVTFLSMLAVCMAGYFFGIKNEQIQYVSSFLRFLKKIYAVL